MDETAFSEAAVYPLRPPRPPIRAACPRYVCAECRTKTGWPHQIGCGRSGLTAPGCADCRYWSAKKDRCDHPAARKERAAK